MTSSTAQPSPSFGTVGRAPSMRGVTLIEMIVVIAILGVLIALVAPSMRGMMGRQRVQGINAELVTDIQMARSSVSQSSETPTSVAITFGGNDQISCYTLHTGSAAAGVTCDCTLAPASACTPAGAQIKTVQVSRASGVTLASSPGGSELVFAPPQGVATPANLFIDVQDVVSGRLRTQVNGLGRPTVCSPDGSIAGVLSTC